MSRTRLVPPRLPPGCLPRQALVDRLAAASARGPVAVVAGAGYGKSTLLARLAAEAGMPVAWCSFDAGIRDGDGLLAHLTAAAAEPLPGFGSRGPGARADDAVAALTNELLDTVADGLLFVLDDVHLLPAEALTVLGRIVPRLPADVRLVLASRSIAPLAHALGGRGTTVVGEAELALDREEVGRLLAGFGASRPAGEADRLATVCEGWVTGVILAAHAGTAALTADRDGRFWAYFASEVLEGLEPERRRFLLLTAVVDRFNAGLAAALTGCADAGEVIERLVDDRLFCIPVDGDPAAPWYRYHHLLQDVLRARLARRRPAEVAECHRRAAAWFRRAGDPLAAVPHLLAAGDHAEACDVLEPVAEGSIRSARAADVRHWLDAVPAPLWRGRPRLALTHAALLSLDGRYEDAFRETVDVVERLSAEGDHDRASHVVCRLIRARGGVGLGLVNGVDRVAAVLEGIDPGARWLPHAHILLGGFYGWLCRFGEAERHIGAGLALPGGRGCALAHLYAAVNRAHLIERIRGRAGDVPEALEAAIDGLRAREAEDEFDFVVHASGFRAFALSYVGRHDEAMAETRRQRLFAGRTAEAAAAEQVSVWIEVTAFAEGGRWDELEARLAAGARGRGPFEGSAMGYYLNACRAQLHAARGDGRRLAAEIDTCRALMRAHLGGADFTALSDLARAALRGGEPARARELAHEALEVARGSGAGWGRARAALMVAAADAGTAAGAAALAEALRVTEPLGLDELWALKERELAEPLLRRAARERLGDAATLRRLATACDADLGRGRGSTAGRRPRAGEVAAGPVRIHLFGPLRVVRGGAVVPRSAYGRERARQLLAVLAAHGAPVARDRLLDWLWPDLSPQRGTRALSTTLHSLRAALEPGRPAGAPSLVALDRDTCRLALRDGDGLDLRDFLAACAPAPAPETAAARAERLMRAEAIAEDPLLPEWPYAEWAEDLRRRVAERRAGALGDLADALMELGRPREAVERLLRLTDLEPYREEWHRRLMAALAEAGEPALALRQYHACRTVLRRELGVDASEATRRLYREILASV